LGGTCEIGAREEGGSRQGVCERKGCAHAAGRSRCRQAVEGAATEAHEARGEGRAWPSGPTAVRALRCRRAPCLRGRQVEATKRALAELKRRERLRTLQRGNEVWREVLSPTVPHARLHRVASGQQRDGARIGARATHA
jgi:hypothetical protein